MLHRGSKLKNTEWLIGLACYCGKETAIMMGGNEASTKTSNIEVMVNKMIIVVFIFEVLCSLGSAVFCYFRCVQNIAFEQLIRLGASVNCLNIAAISLGSYYILYNTFIPISLIVSLEFVKVFQGIFMERDKEMYCGINDRKT
jgi:magnesium-transporting ATPase (P-type)